MVFRSACQQRILFGTRSASELEPKTFFGFNTFKAKHVRVRAFFTLIIKPFILSVDMQHMQIRMQWYRALAVVGKGKNSLL